MERLKATLRGSRPSPSTYEPLEASISSSTGLIHPPQKKPFSWPEYGIFVLLGVAMLWAW
jgi:equilibrative nucleoside transporter 1/2/3